MKLADLNEFRGFYPMLDKVLDQYPHDRIWRLIFSRRQSDFSVGLVVRYENNDTDRVHFETLIGFKLPDDFYLTPEGNIAAICVDLESLNTDKVRLYKDQPHGRSLVGPGEPWIENIGYYLDREGNVYGTKTYTRDEKVGEYRIHYYDKDNNLLKVEKEVLGKISDWNGPSEIVDVVKKQNLYYAMMKKVSIDQGYFIVTNNRMP